MGNNTSKFSNCGNDCPVEKISWNDAQEFIRKLNNRENMSKYRLPTKAEWEYPTGPVTDPTGSPVGQGRVLRGGSWFSHPEWIRSASRFLRKPDYRCSFSDFCGLQGFRVARDY